MDIFLLTSSHFCAGLWYTHEKAHRVTFQNEYASLAELQEHLLFLNWTDTTQKKKKKSTMPVHQSFF